MKVTECDHLKGENSVLGTIRKCKITQVLHEVDKENVSLN